MNYNPYLYMSNCLVFTFHPFISHLSIRLLICATINLFSNLSNHLSYLLLRQPNLSCFTLFSSVLMKLLMSWAIRWGSSMAAKCPPRVMGVKVVSLLYFCLTHSLGVCISSLGKQANAVGTYTGILRRERHF